MYKKDLLSFCIPTYNRAVELKIILEDLISIISELEFDIVISDNCSSDDTSLVVAEFKKQYKNIFYKRQIENIGPDRNFEEVLKLSESVYSWLLGDTYFINRNEIAHIVEILSREKYDIVFLNSESRITNIPSKEYNKSSQILKEIGWHITLMSSLIYKKNVIHEANFKRYYQSNFIQNGIVFEFLESNNDSLAYWYDKPCIGSMPKESVWRKDFLLVFGKNWTDYVLSLPRSIPLNIKLNCIKDHGINSRLFSLQSLIRLRSEGLISRRQYHEFRIYLYLNSDKYVYLIFFLAMYVPIVFLKELVKMVDWYKRRE